MEDICLIQLSDFHIKFKDDNHAKRKQKFDALKEKIVSIFQETKGTNWYPQFIVLTGDIAHSAQIDEYKTAVELFKPIFEQLKEEFGFDSSMIIAVPGNHDKLLNNKSLGDHGITEELLRTSRETKMIKPELHVEYLKHMDIEIENEKNYQEMVKDYFYNFDTHFCTPLNIHKPFTICENEKLNTEPEVLATYTYGIHEFSNNNVSFYGINTAICSLFSPSDYGKLGLQQTSVDKAKSYFLQKKVENNNHTVISLMHHPPGWLRERDFYSITNGIAVFGEITSFSSVILCGHSHNNMGAKPDYYRKTPLITTGAIDEKLANRHENWGSFNLIRISRKDELIATRSFEFINKEGDVSNPWKKENKENIQPIHLDGYLSLVNTNKDLNDKIKFLENEKNFLKAQLYPEEKSISKKNNKF